MASAGTPYRLVPAHFYRCWNYTGKCLYAQPSVPSTDSISGVRLGFLALAQPRGGAGGMSPRNWVHKKIPGCVVELNTQNCAWFGSQISLITAMSFREAMPPRTTHQGLCPWTPLGDFRSPDPLCPPHPNPGYATVCRQEISIDRAVQQAPAPSSKCGQCHVDSRGTRLNTDRHYFVLLTLLSRE